ncbi:MAG: hypothetical protein R6X02_34085 [Enhygromyxa sp.]
MRDGDHRLLGSTLARAGGLALALLLATAGCRHRGEAFHVEAPAPAPAPAPALVGVELLVIGQPRESRATKLVARELERRLQAAAAAKRPAIVVWLGVDLGPPGPERSGRCPGGAELIAQPALAELARVVEETVALGARSWGLPGPDLWRCGLSGYEAAAWPRPWQQAGLAYVLRVAADGAVELASRCDADSCELDPPSAPPLVELVFLDLSSWVFPELGDETLSARVIEQQRSLLDALAAQPGPPRLLISPIPIESAGARGLGGRRQRTSFHYLPRFVQEAVAAGIFVGAIGALERDLQLSVDLSNAILRGDRSFIARPIFALVSGSAGGAGHTLPTSRGSSLLPDAWSEHPGFARILIGPEHARLGLHARVGGRWREAALTLPLDPAPLPGLRQSPTIQPCPSCDPHAGAADGEAFVPRTERPR